MSPRFDADEIYKWVEAQTRFGARRPGSAAGHANERYLEERLRDFGLDNVRAEPIPIVHWAAEDARLEVRDTGGAFRALVSFPIPYVVFTRREGVEAPLVWVDSTRLRPYDPAHFRGKVVVTEIRFPSFPVKPLVKTCLGLHDPRGTAANVNHPATYVRLGWHVYHQAARHGAVGFIGILRDQPGGSCRMYAPYGFKEKDILNRPVPGFWVGREDGIRLAELARTGGQARLSITGVREPGLTHNIVGEIPGQTEETVVLSCHHDSPFVSPVEDATGVSRRDSGVGASLRGRPRIG